VAAAQKPSQEEVFPTRSALYLALLLQEAAKSPSPGRTPDRLEEARRALRPDVLVVRSDAGSISDAETMIAEVGRVFGGIDVKGASVNGNDGSIDGFNGPLA
jgi:hypothetical protein